MALLPGLIRWTVTEVTSRRGFLAGMLAAGLCPRPSWADAGNPAYLTAARLPDGDYALYGLSDDGEAVFRIPLPGRGHAAAAHPVRPEAVTFGRRPGTFAIVVDCTSGKQVSALATPSGRHFYGHGVFSADGRLLFATENDYEAALGIVSIWDTAGGYRRIGEFSSGGVGPHDIKLMPDSKTLTIANGGIATHPDAGRSKLNIPTMRPNLSYVSLSGGLLDQVELDVELRKNSIRHLATDTNGSVTFAMQWQGDVGAHPPLLGIHRRGRPPTLVQAPEELHRELQGYVGSVASSAERNLVAITSPRGGLVQTFDLRNKRCLSQQKLDDVGGISAGSSGFATTTGYGQFVTLGSGDAILLTQHPCAFDNHLVRIRS